MRPLSVAGVVVAVASVAAHAGGWFWQLDLIANFRPQLAALGLAVAALLLAGGWRRTGWAVLAVGLVDLVLVGWLWVPRSPDPAPEDPTVRIMSYNVLSNNDRYGDVADHIVREDADVVLLHESSRPWEEAMSQLLPDYRVVRTRDDDHIFGTLVLTRLPAEVEGFGFTEREPRAVEIVAAVDASSTISILGVHPLAPSTAESAGLRDAQLGFAAEWAESQTGQRWLSATSTPGPGRTPFVSSSIGVVSRTASGVLVSSHRSRPSPTSCSGLRSITPSSLPTSP